MRLQAAFRFCFATNWLPVAVRRHCLQVFRAGSQYFIGNLFFHCSLSNGFRWFPSKDLGQEIKPETEEVRKI